jgi:hypothetical protein
MDPQRNRAGMAGLVAEPFLGSNLLPALRQGTCEPLLFGAVARVRRPSPISGRDGNSAFDISPVSIL